MTRPQGVALVLVLALLAAAPALAEEARPGEPVRQLLAEMASVLRGGLEQARGGQVDAALASVRAYLTCLRQLDQLLPPPPETPPEPPGGDAPPRPHPFADLRTELERQGAALAAIVHALPPEARTQFRQLMQAEMETGYQHPVLAMIIRRSMDQAARAFRRQELERQLAQARTRLAQAMEMAARLEQRAQEMEARLDEITDPARRELAVKRVQLAWLDHSIALKQIERLNLLIEILEGELALQDEAPGNGR